MKRSYLTFAVLAARSSVVAGLLITSHTATAEPQYELDQSFHPPVFTARASATRLLVLPDDRFFAFSYSGSGHGFHRINTERCGNLVRFLPDGTRDTTFKLDEELYTYIIRAVATAPGGKFVVACIPPLASLDRTNRVVRLNDDGSIDRSFDAGAGATPNSAGRCFIEALAADGDGRVLVGGQFGDFNGSGRANFLRLSADGSVDTSFAPVHLRLANYYFPGVGLLTDRSIVIQPDGRILIAGQFSHVNETPRLSVARLLGDGTLDSEFVPSGYNPASSSTSSTKRPVNAIALQPDGKVIIAGIFNPTSTFYAQTLVRLSSTGAADATFNAPFSWSPAPSLALVLLSGGDTLAVDNVRLRRFRPDGSVDSAFGSGVPATFGLRSVDSQTGERALFAGRFTNLGEASYSGVARINADGLLDESFRPGELQTEYLPDHIDQRSDGKLVVGGSFDRVDGLPSAQLAILNAGGTVTGPLDLEDVWSSAFHLLPDNKLLRWGYLMQTTAQFFVRRLNSDGSPDPSFTPAPGTMEFQSIDLQSGSYLLSSGSSTQAIVNGVIAARLKSDGSADPSFDLGVDEQRLLDRDDFQMLIEMWDGDNRVVAVLPGDKILYKYFDRDSKYKVVLLGPTGELDESFQTGTATPHAVRLAFPLIYDPVTGRTYQPAEGVHQPTGFGPVLTSIEPDGRLVLAGQFASYNGEAAGGIVRINPDGSLHSTFGSGASLSATAANAAREPYVNVVERDYAGRLLLAGDFDSFDGHPCPGLVRLNGDGSVDTSFRPPVARRQSGIPLTTYAVLKRQAAGQFLLAGGYAASEGSSAATSIFRLQIPTRATGVVRTPGNALQISFTGVPGETYKIEHAASMSSAFSDSGARLQAAPDGTFVYDDPSAFSSLQRFYRAVSQP